MANAIPMLIRCPKCVGVLSEIPGVAVYKCGGCGAILQAKADWSSGKTSSATSSSKNMSDAGSLQSERTNFGKETPASYHSGSQDLVLKAKVSGASGELNIRRELSGGLTKNSDEYEFDSGNWKEKGRSQQLYEQNGASLTEHNLNGMGKKSSQHAISAQHADEVDTMFQKIRNESSFLLRSRSTHVNLPRKAISRFDFPAREQGISSSSEDFRSALNIMGSENGAASSSPSKDPKQSFRYSEKIDQAKILRKVDELRIEIRRYFDRGAGGRGASRLSASACLEGKFPPIFVPPSEQPPASYRSCPLQGDIFSHNEHRGGRTHNAHSHLPVGGGAASSHPLYRDPQSAKNSVKRSLELKCYCRPVSGGAPFVICTRCYNLLQLPADFLLSAKRVHKLRCGACSEALSYTFRPKARPTARAPSEALIPPSEDGRSLSEVLDDEVAAPPRLTHIREGDPVSYSEDHTPSLGKGGSDGGIVEEDDDGGRRSRRSQLHKLMGYSSARFLLFKTFSPSEGGRTEHDR